MQIKQLLNRKIQFWEAGYIQFSCLPGQNYKVINKQEIQVLTIGQKPFSLFAKDIDFTAILGGVLTAVSFADSQELAEYLDLNFFFELSAGADSEYIDFLQRGGSENFWNPLSIQRVFQTSTTFATGSFYMYAMYLSKDTEISSITFSKQGLGPAFLTMAIYDFEAQGNLAVKFTPKNLIFAPSEFVFPTGVVRVQNSFPTFTFAGGWYCFVFNVSTNWRAKGTGLLPDFWGNGELTTSINMIATLNQAAVYTNVMPDPFPQSPTISPNFSNIVPPVPFFHI
jgi:hypothetical protein